MNRAQAQLALERLEGGFDLGELDVAFPQDRRVLADQVRPQQIVPVTEFRFLQLLLVHRKGKRLASDAFTG